MGFGISGSFVYVLQKRISRHKKLFIFIFNLLFFLSLPVCFFLYLQVPFNALLFGLDKYQSLYFILNTLLMLIPFFLGAAIIIVSMMHHQINKVYFANLFGSGSGVLACYLFMHIVHPFDLIYIILLILSTALILSSINYNRKLIYVSLLIIVLNLSGVYYLINYRDMIRISEYKSYSLVRNMPEFEHITERYSPLGLVNVVSAKGLRRAGDLSYNYFGKIPEIYAMFFDYDNLSPIYEWDADKDDLSGFDFLHRTPVGLQHYLLKGRARNSLILGTGGGSGIMRSLLTGFERIDAVEYNNRVIGLMKDELFGYSGGIYGIEHINIHNRDARSYIETTQNRYQLIELEMLDSFVNSASGTASLKEDYIYTIQAFNRLWDLIDEDGVLSITRWLQNPPRDSLKILNTIIDTLALEGITHPYKHIISIRGPLSINVLLFKAPVNDQTITRTIEFCKANGFDLIFYPGIDKVETGIFFIERDFDLHGKFMSLFDNDTRHAFIDNYLFNIKSTTDNKPYFFNFFRLPVISNIIMETGTKELEFSQWGYFAILIMLIPTALISLLFIFSPLFLHKRRIKLNRFSVSSLLFFFCIGTAFFFIEIILIQKLILFLGHPISSISIVIASLLIFSGLGSFYSRRLFKDGLAFIPLMLIIILTVITFSIIDLAFIRLIRLPYTIKILISIVSLFPLSFLMGMPLPLTLGFIKNKMHSLVSWCWGINGFASVNSIFLCAILSLMLGFYAVIGFALAAYTGAFLLSFSLQKG